MSSVDEPVPYLPFSPAPRDAPVVHPMPPSVPPGLRLELSRSRIQPGQAERFDEWMRALNDRYEEMLPALPAERAVFEATFRSDEADGSTWIYHLSVVGESGAGLDESTAIGALHAGYSRSVKEPGWEKLQPKLMLTPIAIGELMKRLGTGGVSG